MRLIRYVINPHTGYKYRLFFDSRELNWCIQGQTPDGELRAVIAWFYNPRKAIQHLKTLAYRKAMPFRYYRT